MAIESVSGEVRVEAAHHSAAAGEGQRAERPPLVRWRLLGWVSLYALGVAFLTLAPWDPNTWAVDNYEPFASIRRAFAVGTPVAIAQVVANGLLFVPIGLLVPLALPRLPIAAAVFAAAVASPSVELIQLQLPGRVFDIDDVILNVTGACVGGLLAGAYRGAVALTGVWRRRRALRATAG